MSPKHALALVTSLSLAAAAHAEEYRQHEAHVHGHVEFNIAQDGRDLLVEITAPGTDVVGFEHEPENAQQEQALKQAIAALKDSGQLLVINSQAQCVIEDVDVSHSLEKDSHQEHEHHEEHGHDDHHNHDTHDHSGHEEHHDEDHHESDTHEHGDHDGHAHDQGGHGEFSAQYRFHCESTSDLNTIETTWFKQFPTTELINVNVFTDTTQSTARLSKDNAKIALK